MEDDALYIARAGSLPQALPRANCAVICIGQRLPQHWALQALPVLLLQGEFSAIGVFNAVSAIFDAFDSWDERLRDSLEQEEGFHLETLLRLAGEKLPYRIGVTDSGLNTLMMIDPSQSPAVQIQSPLRPMPLSYTEQIKLV